MEGTTDHCLKRQLCRSCSKSGHYELGVTTSTLSKTERGPTKTKVIYQCKVNNFHLNLTKNQYFITNLLEGMKKDWASQGDCAEEEALGQLDVEDGMIHGPRVL